jgi:hypothetical protein
LWLRTKLDEPPFYVPFGIRGSSSLVRRIIRRNEESKKSSIRGIGSEKDIKKHPTGLTTGGVLKKICLTKILF